MTAIPHDPDGVAGGVPLAAPRLLHEPARVGAAQADAKLGTDPPRPALLAPTQTEAGAKRHLQKAGGSVALPVAVPHGLRDFGHDELGLDRGGVPARKPQADLQTDHAPFWSSDETRLRP